MGFQPLVFTSEQKVITTGEWYSDLSQNASKYARCFVRRITHVKNLNSSVTHEYLQIILEDTGSSPKSRTRVLAERQQAQDQVIIGRWSYGTSPLSPSSSHTSGTSAGSSFGSSSSSSSSSGGILPLPLWSLTFDDDNLNVVSLANLLRKVTDSLGDYGLIFSNCYVFARTVYDSARLRYHGLSKRWKFSYLRGNLALLEKAFRIPNKAADSFEAQNTKDFQFRPSHEFGEVLDDFYTSAGELLRQDGVELNDQEKEELIKLCKLNDLAKNATKNALENADINEFEKLIQDAVDKVDAEPHKDSYLGVFQRYASSLPTSSTPDEIPVIAPPGITVHKVPDELEQKADEAVKVLVGHVLEGLERDMPAE
ncbi:hypothetical protein DTO271D3_1416 [Paecilomyces variotii]|nr:hypothetical protein DTO169C6_47 [Paecilomyces variotii]KAJ9297427.1 hypothetical protein DTO217A2_8634 [Paecilomyces variotii]KAJ9318159.1 hypothetical protein DTO271D3_1416 [Paecilomyces variotii]